MTVLETLKQDWVIILFLISWITFLIISFARIDWETPQFSAGKNWIWYQILAVLMVFAIIFIYHFLNTSENSEKSKFILEFLKSLLPTILAILSLLYALSSGLFNIKGEKLKKEKVNLEYEINKFETVRDSLKEEVNSKERQLKTTKRKLISKEKSLAKARLAVESIITNINYSLRLATIKSSGDLIIKCIGFHERNGMLITVLDKNDDVLGISEIIFETTQYDDSGYPDHAPKEAAKIEYFENEQKFLVSQTEIRLRQGMPSDEETRNIVSMGSNPITNETRYQQYQFPYWQFELPYYNAEYTVKINVL